MIIMKFGGSSVGNAQRMKEVAALVGQASAAGKQPVVVLSAMSGVTNALIDGASKAVHRDLAGALEQLELVRDKHLKSIADLFAQSPEAQLLEQEVTARMEELGILYKGISYLGELTKRSLDAVSGLGELLSSQIMAALLKKQGFAACYLDAREFIITDEHYGKAAPLWEQLEPKTRQAVLPAIKDGLIPVTQGFIGSTISGASSTLGRGGSDFSASIIGVAIDAKEIQIWTDVDGMMTADPRVIPEAQVLPEVSFQEASELAYFGAKVLHPLTIKPAVEKNIPVRILNTMQPEKPGTLISSWVRPSGVVRAIASKKGITTIFITSPSMLMTHGYLSNIFVIFDKFHTPIDLISTSEISVALTIDQTENLEDIVKELSVFGDVHVVSNVAIVSVVGREFRQRSGIAGEVFATLKDIAVLMISGGASDINLSFVVSEAQADLAVRQLHDRFFSSAHSRADHAAISDSLRHRSRLNVVGS